jgi:hypothetical protein
MIVYFPYYRFRYHKNVSVNNYEEIYDCLKSKFIVNIISDVDLKKVMLLYIKEKNSDFKFNEDTLYIYDEIDSMLDPLKSELNIPDYSLKYIINEELYDALFNFAECYSNKKEFNSFNYSINIRDKIEEIKHNMLKLEYNVNYGFGDDGFSDENSMIAIPYSALKKPDNNSRFSDIDLAFVLTYISYSKLNEKYHKYKCEGVFNDYILSINKNIDDFIFFKQDIQLYDYKNFNEKIFFRKIIYEQFFIRRNNEYNIAMMDILHPYFTSKYKITFSGTTNFDSYKNILEEKFDYYKNIKDVFNLENNLIDWQLKNDPDNQININNKKDIESVIKYINK